jgi:NADH-quinone oxidoreductase subunit E
MALLGRSGRIGPAGGTSAKIRGVARLNEENLVRARGLIALYPHKRSALIPTLHVLQEQDGYLSPDGIEHVAELIELTPAEVRGTASFYEMFHLAPVGRYLVAVCTNIACMLAGAYELLEHMEEHLGVTLGGTTPDRMFTLEDTECLALCGNAPCLVVNWRYFGDMTPERWDALSDDLSDGRLDDEVPPHGTLCRVRRSVGLPAADGTGPAPTRPEETRPEETRPATSSRPKRGAQPRGTASSTVPSTPSPAPSPALDSAGRQVQLATSRTTAAVASTLDPGGGIPEPADDSGDGSK